MNFNRPIENETLLKFNPNSNNVIIIILPCFCCGQHQQLVHYPIAIIILIKVDTHLGAISNTNFTNLTLTMACCAEYQLALSYTHTYISACIRNMHTRKITMPTDTRTPQPKQVLGNEFNIEIQCH